VFDARVQIFSPHDHLHVAGGVARREGRIGLGQGPPTQLASGVTRTSSTDAAQCDGKRTAPLALQVNPRGCTGAVGVLCECCLWPPARGHTTLGT
jgi:hypothetical protein